MKNKLKKAEIILITTSLLIISMTIFCYQFIYRDNKDFLAGKLNCEVSYEGNSQNIRLWHNDKDDIYYFFLPSGIKMEDASLVIDDEYEMYLDDIKLKSEKLTDNVLMNTAYTLRVYKKNKLKKQEKIIFIKSKNVASIFIATETGTMEYLDKDKNNKEKGLISLYDKSGKIEYRGELDSIEGRGTTTWTEPKKPYHIQLKEESNLLKMEKGSDWILLAEYFDDTRLNNKLIFDFASRIGMEYSPKGEFVDLYTNGEYQGLYLLSKKEEFNKLTNTEDSSITLLELEGNKNNYDKEDIKFKTNSGQMIIVHDKDIKQERLEQIKTLVQEAEDSLVSQDGTNIKTKKSFTEYFDTNSWVKKYIIEELFANHDAEWSSQYFYIKEDNKLYAGPVWDYDRVLGNSKEVVATNNPKAFAMGWRKYENETAIKWYEYFYQQNQFKKLISEEYLSRVLVEIKKLTDNEIYDYINNIKEASYLEKIRWNNERQEESIKERIAYLKQHSEFLKEAWSNEKKYYNVYLLSGTGSDMIYNYAVEKGSSIGSLPTPELSGHSFKGWHQKETNKSFLGNDIINKQTIVYAKWDKALSQTVKEFIIRYYQAAPVVAVIFLLLVLFLFDRRSLIKSN